MLYYKHYQAYLKHWRLRVGPIDTRPIYFRFNKTESILVIYLICEPLPLVGNETDSSIGGVWRFGPVFEGDQSVIGWGPRSYSGVCIYSYYEGRNIKCMYVLRLYICISYLYPPKHLLHSLVHIPNIEEFHFMHERSRETAYTISRLCQVRSNYPSTLSDRRDTLYLLHHPAETGPSSVAVVDLSYSD